MPSMGGLVIGSLGAAGAAAGLGFRNWVQGARYSSVYLDFCLVGRVVVGVGGGEDLFDV